MTTIKAEPSLWCPKPRRDIETPSPKNLGIVPRPSVRKLSPAQSAAKWAKRFCYMSELLPPEGFPPWPKGVIRDGRLTIGGKRKAQAKRRGHQLKTADTKTGLYTKPTLLANMLRNYAASLELAKERASACFECGIACPRGACFMCGHVFCEDHIDDVKARARLADGEYIWADVDGRRGNYFQGTAHAKVGSKWAHLYSAPREKSKLHRPRVMLCQSVVCRRLLEIVNKANANFWEFRPVDGFLSDDSDDEALWDPLHVPDAAKYMADLAAERTDSCRRCLEYAHTGWWCNHLGLGRT